MVEFSCLQLEGGIHVHESVCLEASNSSLNRVKGLKLLIKKQIIMLEYGCEPWLFLLSCWVVTNMKRFEILALCLCFGVAKHLIDSNRLHFDRGLLCQQRTNGHLV